MTFLLKRLRANRGFFSIKRMKLCPLLCLKTRWRTMLASPRGKKGCGSRGWNLSQEKGIIYGWVCGVKKDGLQRNTLFPCLHTITQIQRLLLTQKETFGLVSREPKLMAIGTFSLSRPLMPNFPG